MTKRKVLILGAAGRDFHCFNSFFRGNARYQVAAFTATQIPNIDGRRYPAALAGKGYPKGIPIHPESQLEALVKKLAIDEVVLAYSDVSNDQVMALAARSLASGADFTLMGPKATQLHSRRPVVSVCAIRTGCGKSQTSRAVADLLGGLGYRVAVVRHPMPYGNLVKQRCQRFTTVADLDRHACTLEEREEYELHLTRGHVLFAGVDYAQILAAAEKEADVILWDGGNNDFPFYRSDLQIVLVDPHRAGHELTYHPGRTNLLLADIIVVAKSGTASKDGIREVRESIAAHNPRAAVLVADSVVTADSPESVRGKRVLVVEDGPTLTHGGMGFGAGTVAAKRLGAREIVDPREFAVGSIRETFARYPHLKAVLPAMGYGDAQLGELRATIDATPAELVLVGTPCDLGALLGSAKRFVRVRYELDETTVGELGKILADFVKARVKSAGRKQR